MLDTLSRTLTDTINLLIKSFRLSSLFPALCFVVFHHQILLPYLDERGLDLSLWLKNGNSGFLILLPTTLIGYILNYLNFPLIYLAEGYPFRHTVWGKFMTNWYTLRRDWLQEQVESPYDEKRVHQDPLSKDQLADYFPPQSRKCAPTALGNVMAAFEAYSSERYGIDAVYMWPRLLPALDKAKYAVFVQREKEGLDFFLNFAVLSAVLAGESILLRLLLGLPLFTWLALVSGCVAFLSYRAAIANAINWGETIKVAFDLYRYQLAEQLSLESFTDKGDEIIKWEAVSSFIKDGSRRGLWNPRYPLPAREKAQNDPNVSVSKTAEGMR